MVIIVLFLSFVTVTAHFDNLNANINLINWLLIVYSFGFHNPCPYLLYILGQNFNPIILYFILFNLAF